MLERKALPVRTILLDMGNVLVFFSHERMCTQLGELCGKSAAEMRTILLGTELQLDFERGRHSELEFCELLSERVGVSLDLPAVRTAASDIFWHHDDMLPILAGLKQHGYRLVLLSNTSISHFRWIQERYQFLNYFDDCVVSYEAGAIKPEPRIYEVALSKIQCAPEECFYTDDIPDYIAAARQFGLQAEVFQNAVTFQDHLRQRGICFE